MDSFFLKILIYVFVSVCERERDTHAQREKTKRDVFHALRLTKTYFLWLNPAIILNGHSHFKLWI